MADDKYIWIEVEGEDEAIAQLDLHHVLLERRQRDFLEELAKVGVTLLEKNVPQYTGYTWRHVDRSPVDHTPEGQQVTVGIKAGTSYHPVYVNQGTGIFGPNVKTPYTALGGGRLWFFSEKYGRVIGVESVKGQKAQHFLYTTFRELQVFALARLHLGA